MPRAQRTGLRKERSQRRLVAGLITTRSFDKWTPAGKLSHLVWKLLRYHYQHNILVNKIFYLWLKKNQASNNASLKTTTLLVCMHKRHARIKPWNIFVMTWCKTPRVTYLWRTRILPLWVLFRYSITLWLCICFQFIWKHCAIFHGCE